MLGHRREEAWRANDMTLKIGGNVCNVFLCLLLLMAATLSCTQFKKLTRKSTLTDKTKELYYSVPAGLEYADPEFFYREGSSFLIILPNSNEIILESAESQPIDPGELRDRLEEFGSRVSPEKREVFIAAAADVTSDAFLGVLNELRRRYIDRARLLVSGRKPEKDIGPVKDAEDIPFPAMSFPVELFVQDDQVERGLKPDPLTIIVKMVNGKPHINGESFNDLDDVTQKLSEIFQDRERNGVFREGTNEVEDTVKVHIDETGAEFDRDQKYGDIVSIINAVKGGGSDRIILIDSETAWPGVSPIKPKTGFDQPPPPAKSASAPKTISGGVINGKALSLPKPNYPAAAKVVRASGTVTVQVMVDTSGNVTSAAAVSGHPLLRSAAVEAARSARFSPTLLAGEPVKVRGVITYNFVP